MLRPIPYVRETFVHITISVSGNITRILSSNRVIQGSEICSRCRELKLLNVDGCLDEEMHNRTEGMLLSLGALTQLTALELSKNLPSAALRHLVKLKCLKHLSIDASGEDREAANLPLNLRRLTSLAFKSGERMLVSPCLLISLILRIVLIMCRALNKMCAHCWTGFG